MRYLQFLRADRMDITRSNIYLRYTFAVVIAFLALMLKLQFQQYIGIDAPFLLFFSATILSAWYGGFGPGIVTTIITAVSGLYFFLPPYHSLKVKEFDTLIQIIIFVLEGLFACIVFENLRKTDKTLQKRITQQAAIALLGQQALNIENFSLFLANAAKIIAKTMEATYCWILTYIPDQKRFVVRAGYGWKRGIIGKFHIDANPKSQAGYALFSEKPVIVKNMQSNSQFEESPLLQTYHIISSMHVIIPGREKPSGVLGIHATKRRRFSKAEIYFLQSTANILAAAIANNEFKQRKDEFISIASHELKTPVTSIKILTQMMQKRFQKSNDEVNVSNMAKVQKQLSKLTKLINDMLDITKMQTGRLVFQKEPVDLSELVGEIVENVQATTRQHKIVVKGKIKNDIIGDRERISQVLDNLLSNAIKYSPKAKKINVLLSSNSHALIRVQDFGIGIAKKNRRKVFNRFYRVEGKQEERFSGLGIGLYISSQIIKHHGGTIWVDSTEGKGSIFSFTLPLPKKKK